MSELRRDLADAARSLASALARLSLDDNDGEWEVVVDPAARTLSEPVRHAVPPPLPADILFLARSLPLASREARATRAWKAGFWAGEVLAGRLDFPEASDRIAVRSTIYVVLRCDALPGPASFRGFRAFKNAVGRSPYLLCWGQRAFPLFLLAMDLVREFLGDPLDLGALIFSPPIGETEEPSDFLALPVLCHSAGFLLALPPGTFSEGLLTLGNQGDSEVQVGPSFTTSVAGLEEDEAGIMQEVSLQVPCLVVDLKEELASYLRKMDPVTDPVESRAFLPEHAMVVPRHSALIEASRAWLATETGERLAFYSASEEPIPRRPQPSRPKRAHQQRFVPPQSKGPMPEQMMRALGASLGPPPRLRDRLADAILQQSQALTLLVGHLAEGRLQANAAYKPDAADFGLHEGRGTLVYQIRGEVRRFAGQREAGMMMWVLAHIGDCMLAGDQEGAQELLALALVAQEQAAMDSGNWSVAYLEEPPPQLFTGRASSSTSARLKAFAPLCPPAWGTTTLAFIKEIDALQTRRRELAQSASKAPPAGQQEEPAPPKRKPRFPRRPKQSPEA
ncbi:HERC6 [Symbiodinium sp. CCMP2592]|nr:HERC6 [Symbiodinium sp. CCMP2592]